MQKKTRREKKSSYEDKFNLPLVFHRWRMEKSWHSSFSLFCARSAAQWIGFWLLIKRKKNAISIFYGLKVPRAIFA
jgi:hypothetical protein